MEVFADIFVILGVGWGQLGGLLVEGQGVVGQLGLPQQVGDLRGGDRVVGLGDEQLAPDGGGGGLAVGRGLGGVAEDERAPVAERVGVIGLGLVEGLVLGGGLGELLVLASWEIRASRRSRRVGASLTAFSYQGWASAARPMPARVRPSRTRASTSSGSFLVQCS